MRLSHSAALGALALWLGRVAEITLVRGRRLAAGATVAFHRRDFGLKGLDPVPEREHQIGDCLRIGPGQLDELLATGAFAFH